MEHHDYWESLYNHKNICEALLNEGREVAQMLFRLQARRLIALSQGNCTDETETAYVFLTSLNRSLYAHILLHLDMSFTDCCYQCRAHTYTVRSTADLLNAGASIIDCYADHLKNSQRHYQHIRTACAYIERHLEDDLKISQLCELLYVSKSFLCRSFKELTGLTFADYLKQQRIRRARMLLLSTDLSIEDVAAKCGFHSPAYFSTVFKKEMNIAPSAFRARYHQGQK